MKNRTMITFLKDMRSTIRDKKSLSMMLVMPFIIPLFIFILSYGAQQMSEGTGAEIVIGINYPISDNKAEIFNLLELNVRYISEEEIKEAYANNEIIAYVILRDGVYHIYHNPNSQDSFQSAMAMSHSLEAYSNMLGMDYLIQNNINPDNVFNLISYEIVELETNNMFVNTIINLAFTFTIISIATTAITSATDAVAGEKEKGTLETILTFPVSSRELITGKYLANLAACLATAVICIILAIGSLYISLNTFTIFEELSLSLSVGTLLLSFAVLIGFSMLISGIAIAIASYSKTFKEAQSKLQPLAFIPMIPMFLSMMGVQLTMFIAAIPGIGQAMLLEELFVGTLDPLYLLVMFVSNILFLVYILLYLMKLYKSEKILFSL